MLLVATRICRSTIAQARDTDLLAYLQAYEGSVLKRVGPDTYRHREHDSLVYHHGYWYWNSRGRRINALDYLIEIRGQSLVDAVNTLLGFNGQSVAASYTPGSPEPKPRPKPFSLPWAKRCATFMLSYLQRRGIAGNLKKDVSGSDKQYSFCYPPEQPGSRQLAVFEAPIDALSHATLQKLEGWKWNGYRLSLGGTSHVALVSFLERHPEISRVTLHMDNDLAGLVNARKIRTLLRTDQRFRHIRVGVNPPRAGKDYNEKLLIKLQQSRDQPERRREKQAAIYI